MSTYNENVKAAEEYVGTHHGIDLPSQMAYLAAAQVHATLALAEATMLLVRQGGQR